MKFWFSVVALYAIAFCLRPAAAQTYPGFGMGYGPADDLTLDLSQGTTVQATATGGYFFLGLSGNVDALYKNGVVDPNLSVVVNGVVNPLTSLLYSPLPAERSDFNYGAFSPYENGMVIAFTQGGGFQKVSFINSPDAPSSGIIEIHYQSVDYTPSSVPESSTLISLGLLLALAGVGILFAKRRQST